ncbi:MAG: ACP S-malonyltransferase [Buchnera aphidicola (Nurudea yanoniella)]
MYSYSILFPGQEIPNINLLFSFIKKYPIIKKTFEESSDYIKYNLKKLIENHPQELINKSKYIQLITLTASIAIYRLWKNKNEEIPLMLAGHSLGEYSALVCSKSLKFRDAIKLIIIRNKLMKECMKEKKGAMHAILGLKKCDIQNILRNVKNKKKVSIACINTPYQIVISGEKSIVSKISTICKKNGAKKIFRLSINPPSHCLLMKRAAKKLLKVLKDTTFKKPIFPVVNNVDAKIETSVLAIQKALSRQLYCPVRWMDSIIYLSKKKTSIFLEAGLNNTLTKLNKFLVAIPSISLNNENKFI